MAHTTALTSLLPSSVPELKTDDTIIQGNRLRKEGGCRRGGEGEGASQPRARASLTQRALANTSLAPALTSNGRLLVLKELAAAEAHSHATLANSSLAQ